MYIKISFLLISEIFSLTDVSVIIPQAVNVMDTVTLQCRFNLQGEPLYTVKWYKGMQEFFRYIPKELPNTQVFALPGINVDVSIHSLSSLFKKKKMSKLDKIIANLLKIMIIMLLISAQQRPKFLHFN